MTPQQAFLRRIARELEHLWCSVCKLHPPRFIGGPCEHCDDELGAGG